MTGDMEGLSVCVGLLAVVNALLAFLLLLGSDTSNGGEVVACVVVGGLALAGGYALGSKKERR